MVSKGKKFLLEDEPAKRCREITTKAGSYLCTRTLSEALGKSVFKGGGLCLNPDVCSIELKYWCPEACGSVGNCTDTRQLSSSLSYPVFAGDFLKSLGYKALYQSTTINIFSAWVQFASHVGVLLGVARSTALWEQWSESRRWTYHSAVFFFSVPFVTSLLPRSFFVNWDAADADINDFVVLTRKHYGIRSQIEELTDTTQDVCSLSVADLEKGRSRVETRINTFCKAFQGWSPGRALGWAIGKLSHIESGCSKARRGAQTTEEYIKSVQEVCDGLDETVQTSFTDGQAMMTQFFGFVRENIRGAKSFFAMIYGLNQALRSFTVLWPAAIAIIPGLVQAAAVIKLMIPEATLPGLFIILLPLLYSTMSWALYNVVVETFGDPLLSVALLVFAGSPLVGSIVAGYHHIAAPMDGARAEKVFCRLERINTLLLLVGIVCFILYVVLLVKAVHEDESIAVTLYGQAKEQVISALLGNLTEPWRLALVIFTLFVNIEAKKLMTKISSGDWLLRETAQQRQFETVTKNWRDLVSKLDIDPNKGRYQACLLQKKREERLDALVELVKVNSEKEGWMTLFTGDGSLMTMFEGALPW
eukprot:CAMPEP_0117460068 /NCGR_PEP_ID=MMETSP0784-20121206/1807_1 /TAXON_ID=39447 /ORGANISM="" /LENGTH=588 /DNA_ID=CAMNT_0005253709 /DNA_START=636 /DNA_END=2402 /DNA_ORIENTATION=+